MEQQRVLQIETTFNKLMNFSLMELVKNQFLVYKICNSLRE